MDELTMLREAWGEPAPPAPAAHAAARAALLERQAAPSALARKRGGVPHLDPGRSGSGAGWWHGARGITRVTVAAISLAAAAAVVVAVAVQPGGSPGTGTGFPSAGSGITVAELAYRTATVAAAGPNVRPGQWVYRLRKQTVPPPGPSGVWSTADSRLAALSFNGHISVYRSNCGKSGPSACGFTGQPGVLKSSFPHSIIKYSVTGPMTVSYASLSSLPHDPRALLRYLSRLHLAGEGPAPVREFQIIEQMLISYVMPPTLTAELYRSLADIHGVTINHHAVDIAGRTGVGFQLVLPKSIDWAADELIINPHTYRLMGDESLTTRASGDPGTVISGIAILRQALVSGPGVLP